MILKTIVNAVMNKQDVAVAGVVSLTQQELLYIFRIGNQSNPAGIIDNATDDVLIRNKASLEQLQSWGISIKKTTTLWQTDVLMQIKKDILEVKDGQGFQREYQLSLPKIGLIFLNQRFTRMTFNGRVARVFEQIDCRIL